MVLGRGTLVDYVYKVKVMFKMCMKVKLLLHVNIVRFWPWTTDFDFIISCNAVLNKFGKITHSYDFVKQYSKTPTVKEKVNVISFICVSLIITFCGKVWC